MIQFDKDIDRSRSVAYGNNKTVRDKKIKQTAERHTAIDYDFANRDSIATKAIDNGVIGAVIPEEEKTERPKADDRAEKKHKFEKTADTVDYKGTYDGVELMK